MCDSPKRACCAIDLIDDDAVGPLAGHDNLHLHSIVDAGGQAACRAFIAGINLHGPEATVSRNHMRKRGLAQAWSEHAAISFLFSMSHD